MSTRIAYLNCVGGIAGDMLLCALVEAAGCQELVDSLPDRLGFADVSLEWSTGRPGGFAARRLVVHFDRDVHPHHRNLQDIIAILDAADLPVAVRTNARAVFEALAGAEGAVHGEAADHVHFHEVGAVDALIDVVGVCLALDALGVDQLICSPLPMGRGTVECAHGTLPLPAPAVAALLPGVPVYDAGIDGETVTPTGAALAVALADRFDALPAMTVEAVGIGGGTREYPGLPNVLRVFAGPASHTTDAPRSEANLVVECNVDDLDPRILPTVIESLLAAGALDAYITPLVMKKGRPGHLISVIAAPDTLAATIQVLFRETTTLGCRSYPVDKHTLQRRMETVDTAWGPVPVKVAMLGEQVLRAVPEFDVCAELARQAGVPVRDVLAAAQCAAESTIR